MTQAIIITIIILFFIFLIYNSLIRKRNAVKQSKATIDVYLTQRFDLIPNLVETVKAYAKHEQELLENITKLRASYNQTKNLSQGNELNNKIDKVLLIAEQYPDLKSNTNFLELQKTLTKIEDQLQAARRLYNIDVTTYNTSIESFPTSFFAAIFNFKPESLFEVETHKKENINVKF